MTMDQKTYELYVPFDINIAAEEASKKEMMDKLLVQMNDCISSDDEDGFIKAFLELIPFEDEARFIFHHFRKEYLREQNS